VTSLELAQAFQVSELGGRDIVAELREYSEQPHAKKRLWDLNRQDETREDPTWGTQHAPTLSVGVGHGVGTLVWTGLDESLIPTGGTNTEPVRYEADEWSDEEYPPGAELPIDAVLTVAARFIAVGGRPDTVRWRAGTPEHLGRDSLG
jgi:Immunity protein Imm1